MKEVAGIVGKQLTDSSPRQCASTHRSYIVSQFLAKSQMAVLLHPPYSPDLALCDFFLLDKLRDFMQMTYYGDKEAMKAESAAPSECDTEKLLKKMPYELEKRVHLCIAVQRKYFDGDKIVLPEHRIVNDFLV